MKTLIARYKRLLQLTTSKFHRYKYNQINWNGTLVGLLGARGVGKTTLLLQHIKEELDVNKTLYVNAEDFYFASHKLIDLADEFSKMGAKTCS